MNDDKLLELLKLDPERGMSRLIDQYAGIVFSVIKARLGSSYCESDAEACAADTFSEFYADISKLDLSKGSIKSWLCRSARHNAIDMMRRNCAQSAGISLDAEEPRGISDGRDVEEEYLMRSRMNELLDAIDALGEPDRQIIVRKYYLAQSSKEIARMLGLSVSNVDTRAHRAIKKLREAFGGGKDE